MWSLIFLKGRLADSLSEEPAAVGQDMEKITLQERQTTRLPGTDVRVQLLKWLPHAEAEYASDSEPALRIEIPGSKPVVVPAVKGQGVSLHSPPLEIEVVEVYSALAVRGNGADLKVVDVPGAGSNPALKLRTSGRDGTWSERYLSARWPRKLHGVRLHYAVPSIIGAKPSSSNNPPAVQILLIQKEKKIEKWLIPQRGKNLAFLPLGSMLGMGESIYPALALAKAQGPVKDYKATLTIRRGRAEVAGKTVEVNSPLHYGGYHIYLDSHVGGDDRRSILLVKSDSGMWLVYTGFFVLGAGAFWWGWGTPLINYMCRRVQL